MSCLTGRYANPLLPSFSADLRDTHSSFFSPRIFFIPAGVMLLPTPRRVPCAPGPTESISQLLCPTRPLSRCTTPFSSLLLVGPDEPHTLRGRTAEFSGRPRCKCRTPRGDACAAGPLQRVVRLGTRS